MRNQLQSSGQPITGRRTDLTMVEAVAAWCEGLQGNCAMRNALAKIAESMGADAIALTRASRENSSGSRSIFLDISTTNASIAPLSHSFARGVLGSYFEKPRTGTVWLSTMQENEISPQLEQFQRQRRLGELAVIPLETDQKHIDFLELHFRAKFGPEEQAMMNMILPTLVQTWAKRAVGLFSGVVLQARQTAARHTMTYSILSPENPARLSRAEFRICLLLSRGLLRDAIQEELSISTSTFRTHLRNIYEKTQTTNLAELVYDLVNNEPKNDDPKSSAQVA